MSRRYYTGNLFNHDYPTNESKLPIQREYTAKSCKHLKQIRLYVTRQNRILTVADVDQHLMSLGKRVKSHKDMGSHTLATIHFYERSRLISYVPNYFGDKLLFCNTKYFNKWKKEIEEQYGTFDRYSDFVLALRSVKK